MILAREHSAGLDREVSWIAFVFPMIASACITLAVIHLLIGWRHAGKRAHLMLALMAVSTAAMALFELAMMKSSEPGSYAWALRWYHIPILLNFLAIVGYVRLHLKAGVIWIGAAAVVVRLISLVLNFTTGMNLNFVEVLGLKQISFLGDQAVIGTGVLNSWMLVGQCALFIIVVFVAQAAVQVWRRNERGRAVLAGVGMVTFVILASLQGSLSLWQLIDQPPVGSLFFLGMVIAMAIELSLETLRAAELADELRITRDESRAEVAHLGRVATFNEISVSLAHEMNQPLGIILSNAQAAQRILAKPKPDLNQVREILSDIVQENLRAGQVILSMRDVLKKGEEKRQKITITELVRDVEKLLRSALRERGVSLYLVLPDEPVWISADRIQLQQVLLNLILNACDAVEASPPERKQISITAECVDHSVQIKLIDQGKGLPEEIEVIFEPYFTSKPGGLGMGLAICRSIVASHGGQLHASQNPGGGATFQLTLPLATTHP